MNGVQFASRVLKETSSLVDDGVFGHIHIAGLQEDGLPEHERVDDRRTIWRAPLRTRPLPRSLPFQVLKYLEFCVRMLIHARRVRPAAINVHMLALLPLGVAAAWVCGARLVYDAHELETETNGLTGVRQTLSRWVERLLIRRAAMVIVVGEGIADWYRRTYGLRNVVTVMNCPRYRAPARTTRLHTSLGLAPETELVLYQGGLVPGRGIEALLDAFSEPQPGLALVCMGYGALESTIEQAAATRPWIRLQRAVDPSVVLEYTASATFGVAYIDNLSLNDRLCLPNKLFEYIMAGLPVIVNDAPEMAAVVRKHAIGVVLRKLTADALLGAVRDLRERERILLTEALGTAAREYCWERQAAIMLDGYRRHVLPAVPATA